MGASEDGSQYAAPFVGFVIGAALFGVTVLQAYQYFLRYPHDPLSSKLKVTIVCTLDLLHFILAAHTVYTFLITNFGVVDTKATWSLKALSATQASMIVIVQLLYLHRIYKFSKVEVLNSRMFRLCVKIVILVLAALAIGIGIAFIYEVQKVEIIPRLGGGLQWLIYLGYGTIASIDAVITGMMCFVLYKNRLEIGIEHISRHSNRLLLNLISYALATGLVTTLTAILGLLLYIAKPDTFLYISVMFCITRLYANSYLAMLNVRRRLNSDLMHTSPDLRPPSDIAFRGLSFPTFQKRSGKRDDIFADTPGMLRSRYLPTIQTHPGSEQKETMCGDDMWSSAKETCLSGKSPQWSPYSRRENIERRFSL